VTGSAYNLAKQANGNSIGRREKYEGKKTQAAVRYERLVYIACCRVLPRLQSLTEWVKAQKETAANVLAKQCVCMCVRKFVFISKSQ
jgi:hypothetical protein